MPRGRSGRLACRALHVPGDGSAEPFYRSFGFGETGEVDEGERVMRLALAGVPISMGSFSDH